MSKTLNPIIIRLPNWIGDACMALPAIQLIQAQGWPIVLVGMSWAKDLFSGLNAVAFISASQEKAHLIDELKSYQGCPGIIFPNSFSSAWLFFRAGIKSVAYKTDGRRFLLKKGLQKPHAHEVEIFFELASAAIAYWEKKPINTQLKANKPLHLPLLPSHHEEAQNTLTTHNIPSHFILLAPNATGKHQGKDKAWPLFGALCDALQKQGYTCVICPPPNEQHQAQLSAPSATLIGPLSLPSFAALCEKAQLVICNDSGTSHLASSVKSKQITLFGVTERTRTGPWSDTAVCLGSAEAWPSLEEVLSTTPSLINTTRHDATSNS